jgi:uncharacterized protein (DUF1919 family)
MIVCTLGCISIQPGVNDMITIYSDFHQFSSDIIGVFLENQCYDNFMQKLAVLLKANLQFFGEIFSKRNNGP